MTDTFAAHFHLKDLGQRKLLATFLALVFSLAACLGTLLYVHSKETIAHNLELIQHEQKIHLSLVRSLLLQELQNQSANFLAFTSSPSIIHILASPQDQVMWQRFNESLRNFIQTGETYNQGQLFDNKGSELLRVEKKDRQATIIPLQELHSNAADDFLAGLPLQGGQAISPITLALDREGKPRRPFRPLFRRAAPIFDLHNQTIGTLLFTYEGQPLLDLFSRAMVHHEKTGEHYTSISPQIVNQEGFWLLAPDKRDEWGFARDPQRSFGRRFPEIWQEIRRQGQGQLMTAEGMFTFVTLPLITDQGSAGEGGSAHPAAALSRETHQKTAPFLVLLNQIWPHELARLNSQTQRNHILLFLIVLLASLPLLLWLSLLLRKNREDKKELRLQEQRFRLLYDKAPLPYMSLNPEGSVLNINQTWLTALGYSRNEVSGRWFGSFVAPQSLAYFLEMFPLVTEKEGKMDCEVELIKKDGSTLLASFHSESVSDEQGNVSQTHCLFSDITQLRREEQRTGHLTILLETFIKIHRLIGQEHGKKELMQKCCDILIESRGYASAWIILLDTDGSVASRAEAGLLHNLDQLEQQINTGAPPPCIQECRECQGMVVIDAPLLFCGECPTAGGYPRSGIFCAPLQYESRVYGYVHVSLPIDFIDNQEERNLFNEIARDIGYALFNLGQQEQKRETENSLRQSEKRLRGITDSAQDAILMMDPQGNISFWNPAAERIFGYGATEVLGKNLHTLLMPSRYQEVQQTAFQEFLTSGQSKAINNTIETTARHKYGREIPVTLSLSALLQDGSWHAVGIVRDISEHKRMEEQMLQTEKMSTIAGLAAGVAHEINTPLSAILQSIQVIQQSLSPDIARNQEIAGHCGLDLTRVQDYFQKRDIIFFMDGIKESAIKSARIIGDLLQFSRPRQGEKVPQNLVLLLDKSIKLAKSDYDLRKKYDILNIEIVKEYSPDLPQVACVATDIEQVFINLLKNAAQALSDRAEPKPKARIILRTLLHGEMVRVEIEDNGPGMDEKTRLHIFDPFFTTKDIGVGTGLGLSVVYSIIVSKHGGAVAVRSRAGEGATFTIDLPL